MTAKANAVAMESMMKATFSLIAAGAMMLTPSVLLAKPGHGASPRQTSPTTHTSQGSTNGVGWDHMNGPTHTGQPGVECEDVRPGRSASAPGSAFNEDGKAGTRYAGEQPQNSRNTASVSQYDVACLNQPH